ncbi:Lon family ATP-dependent protease [Clostridium niameyense]|uniref:Lon family ATP-dependent protease n=1 Tax=Clostridium niameyense TaxID=1622073 RepID=UPI00067F02F6|nr:Lon family ATP-dependent protease [Clostridium niameyense]
MKSKMLDELEQEVINNLEQDTVENISLDVQVDILFEILKKLLKDSIIRSRIVKFKLQKYIDSDDICERLYAINRIASNGEGVQIIPTENNATQVLKETSDLIVDMLARRYVENNIEKEVEKFLIDKQEKYIEEIKLSVIKKQKGSENTKTLNKYEELEKLDSKKLNNDIQYLLRPNSFSQIIGQERAIKSLLSKISSPYPQHIILYGPPGVGKTSAARLALEEVKKLKYTPFEDEAKFIEVDGATLRWDPREITNPLLGSVHDPIYQGSKRDLAETGIPEPKVGLVTKAHGGVLFIDEIGELDDMLQNKLLKVLEDKRVEFSSSYYDPDDENIPKYIKYLFEKGAPADFVLIGATTREPSEINPALRSRCTEVFFEPLSSKDIENIVENAAEKLNVELEDEVPNIISRYTIEGRKAVNILSDVYGYALYNAKGENKDNLKISTKDLQEIISINRLSPYDTLKDKEELQVGHIYGLGVSGYIGSTIEIESVVFKSRDKGKGTIRFNETAGSMAKDSVFNAASVIRKITNKDIYDYDIHVNVIGGGKIDGPSAGTAITMCIISSLLNKPLKQDIAITGEISLKGNVKPVGGIFEKIYGARRKGIKTVIIPKDNLKDAPVDLKDIEIIAVDNIEELNNIVF